MAANKSVNMAIDALIRLGLYDEIHGFANYGRNFEDDSFTKKKIIIILVWLMQIANTN